MTFEEVKVGDVLYREEDKIHYLVVGKDDKMIFGRVSSHKAARVNIGNNVEIGIMAIRNFTFDNPDSFFYEDNKKRLEKCKKVFEVSPSVLYQFSLFEDFVDRSFDISITIKDGDVNTETNVLALMDLDKKISDLRIQLREESKNFIIKHYSGVKMSSGERIYIVRP